LLFADWRLWADGARTPQFRRPSELWCGADSLGGVGEAELRSILGLSVYAASFEVNSIRSTERMTDTHRDTVMRLGLR
jgi:hypothetical protein